MLFRSSIQQAFEEFRVTEEDRKEPYRLRVNAVANLERMRAAEFQKLLLLADRGFILPDDIIKGADLSNEEEILAKLPMAMQLRAMMAQAQQAQAGQESSPGQALPERQRRIGRSMRQEAAA